MKYWKKIKSGFILSEFNDDSDMVIKSLSGSKQSDTSDNVYDDSNEQCGAWTKVGAEQPHFPFSG